MRIGTIFLFQSQPLHHLPLGGCDLGVYPSLARQVLRGSQAIPSQPHSPSAAPRPRGTSRPREYTARAMRRVSTKSPSTIPASTPGLTEEQLHSGNGCGTGVRGDPREWESGGGVSHRGGGVERLGKGPEVGWFGRKGGGLQGLNLPLWAWTKLRPEERKRR